MSKIINYGRSFLLWYAHDLVNFRLQELYAIAATLNIKFEWLEEPSVNDPFLLVNFPSSTDVNKLMSRTVLIRSAYELWAKSRTLSDLHAGLKNIPKEFIEPYCAKDVSFRIMVESFGKKLHKDYKVQRIDVSF
ncbi:tRNA (guanine(10)-N2)-methyltransferase homolog [Stegodyphus dumicola]|uniref:tRNA (guanine(10)-N2)-methyltransferase homolog n=1 Tax=Stegodyphus dumicola TaxID=202533 RepID=UPI0015B1AC6B|nr:tRNA (guanine(10)-N2)-methyltransferase homolog [Stegodyphus dumicola]